MAAHKFQIKYGADVTTIPDPSTIRIRVGDTVQFDSPDGDLQIDWVDNPFDRPSCSAGEELNVVSAGPFRGACSVTLPDGTVLTIPGRGTEAKTETGETGTGAGGTQ